MTKPTGPHAPLLFLGMDIGQRNDPAAYVGIVPAGLRPGGLLPVWQVAVCETAPLGAPYKALAARARQIVTAYDAQGWGGILAADATGVGRPVLELLREDPPLPWDVLGITAHGGHRVTGTWPDLNAPKSRLVSALSAAIDNRALTVPEGPATERLAGQLLTYRAKARAGGRVRYEAARETDHDDLVSALQQAMFAGETWYSTNADRSGRT
ncbi:hypothetical protein ACIPRL_07870 [Streptomyces sp. NPDC090085]|uniref:phage terminase large subunit family protein n=1 Tax=Streptomyces sp. NPDC090085 TaxID=3365943 RepID=UPI00381E7E65